MWQPGWEGSLEKDTYMHMYSWIPLLSTWNYHNIVNQLYSNTKLKGKKKRHFQQSRKQGLSGQHCWSNSCSLSRWCHPISGLCGWAKSFLNTHNSLYLGDSSSVMRFGNSCKKWHVYQPAQTLPKAEWESLWSLACPGRHWGFVQSARSEKGQGKLDSLEENTKE